MSRSPASLSLFDAAPLSAAAAESPSPGPPRQSPEPQREAPQSQPATSRPALWLALVFPYLAIEVRGGRQVDAGPLVVVDREGRVVQASEPAGDAGVGPGLPLNAALALCPGLRAVERDEAGETDALARLAGWAGGFTSGVSPEPPDALLLEIGGSLRLFGGLPALRARLRRALTTTGHEALEGIAPTPLAALWLARAGEERPVISPAGLPGRLGPLPPWVTGWSRPTLSSLRGLGVERLADCLRLPRDGFARRLGRGALADLDRALGRSPDPRVPWRPPARYAGRLELAAETADPERLAGVMDRLFAELEGFLRGRQLAVTALDVRLGHLRPPATKLVLGLVRPEVLAGHFSTLFRERLERLALPAPVIDLALRATPSAPLVPGAAGLFGAAGEDDGAGARLVERLRARLGREAVHGLGLRDEHRPETAWAVVEPGAGSGEPAVPLRRPAWLLDPAQPLECREGRPWREGPLRLESGPERLETGWWDGRDVQRDYWVASGPAGERLWIFLERGALPRWFLHGIFG